MILMKSVSKSFESKKVLNNLNLSIAKGSVFGLVGPNGSGKSTVLRILSGIYQIEEGFVRIDDQPVYDNTNIKRRLFFVADEPFFFNHSTMFDMKKFYQLFYPSFSEEQYQQLMKVFPISEKIKISTMSKGMKRQVLLILALAARPDYLFLDEAFDGLDPVMRLSLKRMIAEEVANRQMTVIISSHNLRELEDICDSLGLLSNAKIEMAGLIDDLKSGVHKIQVAFQSPFNEELLKPLNVLHLEQRGSVVTAVVRNDEASIRTLIQPQNPAFFELLPISLEELFVYEMEVKGYGKNIE